MESNQKSFFAGLNRARQYEQSVVWPLSGFTVVGK
jgi:hypothetical protein